MAKCALSDVVAPRDSVAVQKREERFLIARESLVVCYSDFALWRGSIDGSFVKSFDRCFVLA